MERYLFTFVHERYGRDEWVTEFVDTVQYYVTPSSLRPESRDWREAEAA